jgi:alkanesulfonate monooxygenase SsuD/methylene tetrahydromethanopterin reductase-like flavin-dependent oxidoreductase (luciferase family)
MWIAGGGEKVTLRIAAEYAQYTNFGGKPEEFEHKSALLRQHCADAGTDFGAITRSTNYSTIIASTEAEVQDRINAVEARLLPHLGEEKTARFMAEYRDPDALAVGTPEQVAERLQAMQKRGLGYSIHYFPEAAYDRTGIELFEREVAPALA